jgi:hypothetical protein
MEEPDDPVPVFRSWPRIYGAVLVCAVLAIAAIALFSAWPY